MNCLLTLEQLDCVRPNSDDLVLPEFTEARTHLENCESCRIEFARRQRFDGVISNVMPQVVVPIDQPGRLLASLSVLSETSAASNVADALRNRNSRSGWRWRVAALATCAALILAITFWQRPKSELAVEEVLARLSIDIAGASVFDGKFQPPNPVEWSSIELSREVRGQDLDGVPGHEAAVRVFRFDSRRGHVVQGLLVTLPASRVSPAPAADHFIQASPRYPSFGEQRFAAAAWQEGTWVFICLIPDHPGDLDLLQRATQGTAA